MILDAGVLIAIDRNERGAGNFVAAARRRSQPLRTTAPVVAQVWRDGSRQARLAQLLPSFEVLPFTPKHVPLVGTLLRNSGTSDVVDAHVLACALNLKDSIVTADFGDFAQLTGHLRTGSPVVHHWR